MIRIKRIYDPPSPGDGKRILVDRLWPRGVAKEDARLDEWLKEIAPSDELRHWFGHEPEKWDEFRSRYRQELQGQEEILNRLRAEAQQGTITILFAAKDEEHNNAVVLKELLG
jgi:uncharacterized protein YeaO (DUF488 family)